MISPSDMFKRVFSASSSFVAVNCFCSLGTILQYVLFMRFFEFRDMGTMTLFHTIITITGMTQLGLLNGGFRVLSQKSPYLEKRVNDTIFSFFGMVFVVAVLLLPLALIGGWKMLLVSLGIAAGVMSMMKNWLTNVNIARANLAQLNWVNLATTLFSFLFFLLIPVAGVVGGLLVVAMLPISFCTIFLCWHREMRPTRTTLRLRTIRWLLYFGFVPFLTGIMTLINLEIGNLGITFTLGKAELGKFALVQQYTSCFMLIPTALTLIFFPRMLRAHKTADQPAMTIYMRNYGLGVILYVVVAAIGTLTVLPPVIKLLFPKYVASLPYVYMVLPGLCLTVLGMPFGTILYVNLVLRPVFGIYLTSALLTAIGIVVLHAASLMSLRMMAVLKCSISGFIALAIFGCFLMFRKKFKLRYL